MSGRAHTKAVAEEAAVVVRFDYNHQYLLRQVRGSVTRSRRVVEEMSGSCTPPVAERTTIVTIRERIIIVNQLTLLRSTC